MFEPDPAKHVVEIQTNRAGYPYGPPLIENSSFFPTGILGEQLVANNINLWEQDASPVDEIIKGEAGPVLEIVNAVSYSLITS